MIDEVKTIPFKDVCNVKSFGFLDYKKKRESTGIAFERA